MFNIFEHFYSFRFFYSLPEAREVSRNLPGARGSVFPKYGPMAIHLDPIHPQHYLNLSNLHAPYHVFCETESPFSIFWRVLWWGLDPSKKMRMECLHLQMGWYRGSISRQRSNYVGFCWFQEGVVFVYVKWTQHMCLKWKHMAKPSLSRSKFIK